MFEEIKNNEEAKKGFFDHAINYLSSFFKKSEDATPVKNYSDVILVNENGEILILLRSNTDDFHPGVWTLPGGKIESDESALIAAARELLEETNINLSLDDLSEFKRVEKENCIINYFLASVHSGDLKIVLDNEEHQGSEWVKPENFINKQFILDLGDFLSDAFDIVKEEKVTDVNPLPIVEVPLMKSERINSLEDEITKSFDANEIDEEKYFSYIQKAKDLKNDFDSSIVIKKGRNGEDLELKVKNSAETAEADQLREQFDDYISNSFFYKDHIYDPDGFRVPLTTSQIQQTVQQYPSIYKFEDNFSNDAESNAPIMEGLPRKRFEQVLPIIEAYIENYNDFEEELKSKFTAAQNDYTTKVNDIKKTIKDFAEGSFSSTELSFIANYLEEQISPNIDPLIELTFSSNKRQIYLSELKNFLADIEDQYEDDVNFGITNFEVMNLNEYDDNDLNIQYFDADDEYIIKTINSKVKQKLQNKVDDLVDLKKGEMSKKVSENSKIHKNTKLTYLDLKNHAKETPQETLENFIKQSEDPKLRELAHKELERRLKNEAPQEPKVKKSEDDELEKSDFEIITLSPNSETVVESNVAISSNEITAQAEVGEESAPEVVKEINKGCLMFYPTFNKDKWIASVSKMISPDICTDDGYETKPHCTVLYGFDNDSLSIDKLTTVIETYCFDKKPQLVLENISLFQNANDVVKVNVLDTNGFLTGLNQVLKDSFSYQNDYPDYKPHFTLAYVVAGQGQAFENRTIDPEQFGIININSGSFVYSDHNYNKTVIKCSGFVDKNILKSEEEEQLEATE